MQKRLIYPTCISSSHLSSIKTASVKMYPTVSTARSCSLLQKGASRGVSAMSSVVSLCGVFHPTSPRWNGCVPWRASGEGRGTSCRVLWPVWWQPAMKNWGRLQSFLQSAATASVLLPKLALMGEKWEKWEQHSLKSRIFFLINSMETLLKYISFVRIID